MGGLGSSQLWRKNKTNRKCMVALMKCFTQAGFKVLIAEEVQHFLEKMRPLKNSIF